MRDNHPVLGIRWRSRRIFVLLGLFALLVALTPTSGALAASGTSHEGEFRVDTIAVTVTRLSSNSVGFAYIGADGGDCGFEALYISNQDGPVVTFSTSSIPRDTLLTSLDAGVWAAFRTLDCGGNTGDYGSRGLAGQIRRLDVGDSFTVHAATFGDCATPPPQNC
jgi:hypothetical protein